MLGTSRFNLLFLGRALGLVCMLAAASCAMQEMQVVEKPPAAPTPPPAPPPPPAENAIAAEAKAMLAQAETDVQRARAKRALWQKAWEHLLASRRAVSAGENAEAIRHARR